MTAVAIIPARGGSRRIPRKNIRMFHGKPIIQYSIEAAINSRLFHAVFVSTDDAEIASISMGFGAQVLWRPAQLADDNTGTQEVMQYHMNKMRYFDMACCIYPTAPMLSARTLIDAAKLLTDGTRYVVPVAKWLRDPGQFYFGTTESFAQNYRLIEVWTRIFSINPNTECDINTEEDWHRAEQMYAALYGITEEEGI